MMKTVMRTMANRNPFTPSFGSEPLVLAGRRDILESMERAFENGPGDPRLTSIFVGARGTGKTALLNVIPDIAEKAGWLSVSATVLPGMLEDLYQRSLAHASEVMEKRAATRMTGITVANAVGVTWETAEEEAANWRTRMYRILDALEPHGSGLLFTLDEVTPNLDEMIQFAAVYQHFVREKRNVALLMAGLPNNVSGLLSNRSASFLRRSKQYRLGNVDNMDMAYALRQTVLDGGKDIAADALERAVEAIGGFPYMMQLVGFHMWEGNLETGLFSIRDVDWGVRMAAQDMRDGVYRNTFAELSGKDLEFLAAMLEDKSVSEMGNIARRMNVTPGYASQYRLRLIDQGVIGPRGRGRVWFEIPGFDEYLRGEL